MSAMHEPSSGVATAPPASSKRRRHLLVVAATLVAAVVGVVLVFTLTGGGDEAASEADVVATLKVPGPPNWVTAGEDGLWVSLLAGPGQPFGTGAKLERLDLATGETDRTVKLDGVPLSSIRVGDSLWVGTQPDVTDTQPGAIVELDWTTGEVLGSLDFDRPVGGLAYGDGSLWVEVTRPSAVIRVDPATRTVIGEPIPITQGRAIGLAFGEGAVWTTTFEDGMLARIDPGTGRVDKVDVGVEPVGVVTADGLVWVANRGSGTVSRVDPATMQPVGDPIAVGATPTWITSFAGSVWVSNQVDGTVTRIDGATGETIGAPIRIAPAPEGAGDDSNQAAANALSGAGNSLWVTSLTAETVSRIDPSAAEGES
jgi:DNA-binding beta-propeller fold protein YncE